MEEDEVWGRENFGLNQKDLPSKGDKRSSKREDRRRDPSPDQRRASSSDRCRAPSLERHWAPSTSAAASGSGKRSRREAATFKAVNTVFKEPVYKLLSKIKTQPFFKWPRPMRGDSSSRDQSKFCAYHEQNGHRTEDCKTLKAHLEDLVKEGHLSDHIKEEGKDNNRPLRQDDGGQDSEPEGIININHLAPPPKGSS